MSFAKSLLSRGTENMGPVDPEVRTPASGPSRLVSPAEADIILHLSTGISNLSTIG